MEVLLSDLDPNKKHAWWHKNHNNGAWSLIQGDMTTRQFITYFKSFNVFLVLGNELHRFSRHEDGTFCRHFIYYPTEGDLP